MQRWLQIELDSKFFDTFGEAFLKSFYKHNKGWDLYVSDLGLTDDQRAQLSKYGVVKSYPVDPCRRWIHLTARIQTLADIVKPDTLVLRMDTDGIVLDGYADVVKSHLDGNYEVTAMELPHTARQRSRCIAKVARMLGREAHDAIFDTRAISLSFMLLSWTPRIAQLLAWLRDNWREYHAYSKDEEAGVSAAMHVMGAKINLVSWDNFCPVNTMREDPGYALPCKWPLRPGKTGLLRGVHFPVEKLSLINSVFWRRNEGFKAWRDVLIRPHAKAAWPDPGAVRATR
jgi:hypothetical protein